MINKNVLQKQTLFKIASKNNNNRIPLHCIMPYRPIAVVNGKYHIMVANRGALSIDDNCDRNLKISSSLHNVVSIKNEKAIIMRPIKDCNYNK